MLLLSSACRCCCLPHRTPLVQLLSHLYTSITLQCSIKGIGNMFSVRAAENKVDGTVRHNSWIASGCKFGFNPSHDSELLPLNPAGSLLLHSTARVCLQSYAGKVTHFPRWPGSTSFFNSIQSFIQHWPFWKKCVCSWSLLFIFLDRSASIPAVVREAFIQTALQLTPQWLPFTYTQVAVSYHARYWPYHWEQFGV